MKSRRTVTPAAFILVMALISSPALAQKKYDSGATESEIKVGQSIPYSGPASAFGQFGKAEAAYFKMINDQGGINGRKIVFISLDAGYQRPKAVENARRLVEQEEVLVLFNPLGTRTNLAIRGYMNAKKVPQLFVASGSSRFNDPKHFPWTMGFQPNYQTEARFYAQQILKVTPNAKIAVLYQNDNYGKDNLKGFKDGLGDKVSLIVAEATYESTDPTIDSQILTLKDSGADVLVDFSVPKFAAQAIRKVSDSAWRPTHYLSLISSLTISVLQPAGLERSVGLISMAYNKDPGDHPWDTDPAMMEYRAFMSRYMPESNPNESLLLGRLYLGSAPDVRFRKVWRQPDSRKCHEAGGQHS